MTVWQPAIGIEEVGLLAGLAYLFVVGAWWCWVCDVIDAYPEAFGLNHSPARRAGSRTRTAGRSEM